MQASENCLNLIKHFEGCRLSAYQDSRNIWTIGVGHTKGVSPGMVITQEQADQLLSADLVTAEEAVNSDVRCALNQNEFDALCSLCFNIGSGNFKSSTVVRKLNAGDIQGAADAILMWNRVNEVVSAGLQRRREAERALFLTPVA